MEKGMKSKLFLYLFVLGVVMGVSFTHQEIPPPSSHPPESSAQVVHHPSEPILGLNIGIPEALAKTVAKTEELDLKKSDGDSDDDDIVPLEQPSLHDLDFEMNNRITWWIKRFTGPEKKYFRSELANFDTVRPTMEKIFASYGIPRDMVYLCMIESGGRPNAVSPSGATGYWQFTADTARNYKLTVNSWVDERRDIIKSTHAAAKYLKSLYAIFNDWLLASAAYNAGEGNLYRIMKAHPEINTFWDISHHMPIKHETLDYIPKLIATIVLAKNRAYYGLNEAEKKGSVTYDTVRVPSGTYLNEIADLLGVPNKEICLLNADLVKKCTPPSGEGHVLKVPKGTAEAVAAYIQKEGNRKSREAAREKERKREKEKQRDKEREKEKEPEDVGQTGKDDAEGTEQATTHVVKKGETLYRIAKENSVTVASLREANELSEGQDIAIGQELVIPVTPADGKGAKEVKESKAKGEKEDREEKEETPEKPAKKRTHVVARGETLKGIARAYDLALEDLLEANDIGNAERIQPRMVLNIPSRNKQESPKKQAASKKEVSSPRDVQYKVKKGDTIWSISKHFEVSTRDVIKWNKLKPTARIQPGDELTIRVR
jgi:membrane-bound lytic murein transglycosylase D